MTLSIFSALDFFKLYRSQYRSTCEDLSRNKNLVWSTPVPTYLVLKFAKNDSYLLYILSAVFFEWPNKIWKLKVLATVFIRLEWNFLGKVKVWEKYLIHKWGVHWKRTYTRAVRHLAVLRKAMDAVEFQTESYRIHSIVQREAPHAPLEYASSGWPV